MTFNNSTEKDDVLRNNNDAMGHGMYQTIFGIDVTNTGYVGISFW